MTQLFSTLDTWTKGLVEGYLAGLVTPYVIKNFGYTIYQDLKTAWLYVYHKIVPVTVTVVTPTPVV
jgi:hypothetical protein